VLGNSWRDQNALFFLKRKAQKAAKRARKVRNRQIKLKLPTPTRGNPGYCEACGRKQEDQDRALSVDHCHKTGIFRGWLCSHCNLGLGKLGDTLDSVRNMLRYLERAYSIPDGSIEPNVKPTNGKPNT